ncbi:hypothetical protein, partial [Vibrio sp. V40_P2S30T141]|uniref:hypothetical protein n=1 Tax=Vibrio sp. V40_P2S30T141 TaxID=1938691 RepID=UPI0013734F76
MKLLFGFILGFIFTMFWVGFDLAWDQKNNPIANSAVTLANDLDGNLVTNIAIAIATIVASVIAMTNYYSSQKNREWEIRKEPLFKLLKALTKSMESTQKLYGNALAEQVGEQRSSGEAAGKIHIGIDSELNELLNVYKPLFPQSIIQAVG